MIPNQNKIVEANSVYHVARASAEILGKLERVSLVGKLTTLVENLGSDSSQISFDFEGTEYALLPIRETSYLMPVLELDGVPFIVNAYRAVLGRNPDLDGLIYYCNKALDTRLSKIGLIRNFRESPEGQSAKHSFRDADRGFFFKGKLRWVSPWRGKDLGTCLVRGTDCIFEHWRSGEIERIDASFQKVGEILDRVQRRQLEELDRQNSKPAFQEAELGESLQEEPPPYFEKATSKEGFDFERALEKSKHDAIYLCFENIFYESETVLRKQRFYLPHLTGAKGVGKPFLDLGCGRGEFLSILQEEGFAVEGVELNALEAEDLDGRGYTIHNMDLFAFLEEDKRNWCGISLIHVIEHLDTNKVIDLFEDLFAKIDAGGSLIIETINPHCPLAFASFYMDHTHVKPYAPEVIAFHMQRVGFKDVKVVYTNLVERSMWAAEPRRNYHDFGVVGKKP